MHTTDYLVIGSIVVILVGLFLYRSKKTFSLRMWWRDMTIYSLRLIPMQRGTKWYIRFQAKNIGISQRKFIGSILDNDAIKQRPTPPKSSHGSNGNRQQQQRQFQQ